MGLFADYEPQRHRSATPKGLWVRPALLADVPSLAALRVARGDATPDEARAAFHRLLARAEVEQALVLAAGLEEQVLGFGVVEHLAAPGIPQGWYLGGVVVAPAQRRRGIGARLTHERLAWTARRATRAYYFVNAQNRASIDMHAPFGFRELVRGVQVPGVTFTGGVGLLFEAPLGGA